jgi:hypothetical protein
MNLFALLWLALLTAAQAAPPQTSAVIGQGIVTDSSTGDPLPSVQVRMTSKVEAGAGIPGKSHIEEVAHGRTGIRGFKLVHMFELPE